MVSGEKIDLFELYNFDVHKFISRGGIILKNSIENIFFIYFLYISGVTSTSPSVSDGVVHGVLTVPTAKLLSSWDLSFDIHIEGGPVGVFNFTFRTSGEGAIKKLSSDSDPGAQTTPGTTEKGHKFDYE